MCRFLWVNLQLDHLCQASKAQKDQVVEEALETLPQGLPDTYNRILDRIEGQSPYMKELALNSLAWMIYAKRPLSTEELQHALATNSKCKSRNDLHIDPPKVILEACGNLLEESMGAIRPIHYTVQEFLTTAPQGQALGLVRTQLLDSNAMHARISSVCLTYIHLSAFNRPAIGAYDLMGRIEDSKFAGYACQSFDHHIAQCNEVSPHVTVQLEELLRQDRQHLAAVLQIKILRSKLDFSSIVTHFDPIRFSVSASTIVYSTSLYDVPAIRQCWVGDASPTYALQLASSAGLVKAVSRLLDTGCDIDERDREGRTPLYHACLHAHIEIVHTLLGVGADVNVHGGYFGNAFQAASASGYTQTVKLLLENNADVNVQGGHFGNALQAASARGYEQTMKLLLENNADVNAQGGYYGTALQAASAFGHEQIVKLLLENNADVNAQGGEYGTALQAASARGYEQIVKLLLENNADVNAQGGEYGTALQAASARGYEQTMKLLLENNADVNAQGGYYGNAL
jgi:ankyrin repeat protein